MSENKKDLSKHSLETARETMRSAKYNFEGKFYRDAINRAYYVVFYVIKAVLALDGKDFKRHKDAIAYFNKEYVATGIFSREVGKNLGRIKMKREEGDYTDFFLASCEEASKQVERAEYILKEIEIYLKDRI